VFEQEIEKESVAELSKQSAIPVQSARGGAAHRGPAVERHRGEL
jgi:hypothetical protein